MAATEKTGATFVQTIVPEPDELHLEASHLQDNSGQVSSIIPCQAFTREETAEGKTQEPTSVIIPATERRQMSPIRGKASNAVIHQAARFESMDYCDKIYSSAWQEAHDMQEQVSSTRRDNALTGEEGAVNTGNSYFRKLSKCNLKERFSSYRQEWVNGFRWKVVFVSHRVFWTNLTWCLVLGTWLEQKTAGKMGVIEVIFSSAVCGSLFHVLGGNPILIVGVSAPSVIFVVAISTSGERLGLDIVAWMGWIGLWSSAILLLLAVSNASRMMINMTYFGWEVMQVFVCFTLMWAVIEQIIHFFDANVALDSSLLSLWLATSAFYLATFLESARNWHVFDTQICDVIADYASLIVLLLFSIIPHLPKLARSSLLQVHIPSPGYHTDQLTKLGTPVKLKSSPFWSILLAFIPGTLLAGMFFVDQNATYLLVQEKAGLGAQYNDSKNWDLFIIAWLTVLCSVFGLPFICPLLLQNVIHARALAFRVKGNLDVESQQRIILNVNRQRVSGIIASLLLGLLLLPGFIQVVRKLPQAVLSGLFLQMAYQNFRSRRLISYVHGLLKRSARHGTYHKRFSASVVSLYTFIQIVCVLLVFGVSKTPAAVLFPLFILATFWVRHYVLFGLFEKPKFAQLDPKLQGEDSDISAKGDFLGSPQTFVEAFHQHVAIDSAIMPPITGPPVALEPDSSGSPHLDVSPFVLRATTRRLKERSRRRQKRRRYISLDADDRRPSGVEEKAKPGEARRGESSTDLSVPSLVKAMMHSNLHDHTWGVNRKLNFTVEDISVHMSKRVSPTLSPLFFKRSQLLQRLSGETSLEVHSNFLFEPDLSIMGSSEMQEENKIPAQVEQTRQADISKPQATPDVEVAGLSAKDYTQNTDGGFTAFSSAREEMDCCSPKCHIGKHGVEKKKHTHSSVQASPGIRRYMNTTLSKTMNTSARTQHEELRRQSRRRVPLKEEIYPSTPLAGIKQRNLSIGVGRSATPNSWEARDDSLGSNLNHARKGKWPTSLFKQRVEEHLCEQGHAASELKQKITYTV